ncbi:serine hydrolase domain-containing protein [Streptomyces europaeiscabiei]|uniref:serine hydrolase domain-containing protein n=1 Tax=Streptomyces europaeiscabiei TaxID=146819 RepID=UPI002E18FD50
MTPSRSRSRWRRQVVSVSRSPGCAAVVGVRRSVVWEAGRGKADLTTGRAPTSKSMFEMASNSERFTADAVLLLAGRRQLALNEPLSDYLDNSQAWAREVTLGDLMRHTSGIPDYQDLLEAKGMELMDPAGQEEAIAAILASQSQDPPGEGFSYSKAVDVPGKAKSYDEKDGSFIRRGPGLARPRLDGRHPVRPRRVP